MIQRRHFLIGGAAAGLIPLIARAQEAAKPAPGPRTPFTYTDGKIRVPVRVGQIDVSTVIDSGALYNSMDARLARDFHIASAGEVSLSAIGGSAKARFSDPLDISLGGKAIPQSQFAVLDLSKFSASVGQPVDLILGAPLFRAFVVDIDFETKTLALFDPDAFELPESGAMERIALMGGLMTAKVYLPHGSVEATVDTGSDAPLILSPSAALRLGVLGQGPESTARMTGIGGTVIGKITSTPTLGFAAQLFEDVPIQIAPREFGSDANVGCGLLSKFRVAVDFKHDWLVLSDVNKTPFKRDLTGLKATPQGAALKITHIATGGPAAAAGLKIGDIIQTMNGEPAVTANQRLIDAPAGTVLALGLRSRRAVNLNLARYY